MALRNGGNLRNLDYWIRVNIYIRHCSLFIKNILLWNINVYSSIILGQFIIKQSLHLGIFSILGRRTKIYLGPKDYRLCKFLWKNFNHRKPNLTASENTRWSNCLTFGRIPFCLSLHWRGLVLKLRKEWWDDVRLFPSYAANFALSVFSIVWESPHQAFCLHHNWNKH